MIYVPVLVTRVHYEYIRTLTQMEVKMLNNLRWHATIYIPRLAPHAVMQSKTEHL